MRDKITLERINTAHPVIREELQELYIAINNKLPKGVRLRFSHVYRSNELQDVLYNKRPKVTNAKGGQSIHNYGLAFDIVILFDTDGNGTFETASWKQDEHFAKVVSFFKKNGYTWGGDWTSFKDNPHFQKDFGYTWRTLIDLEKFTDTNGISYPKIKL
jgi:peptidoglycan L-alanyl-D-glutamate endopeptidase CwlK